MTDPILRHWRITHEIGVGVVTGHPTVVDGWMTTSRVLEVSDDRTWMRTKSRRYRLADPFPDDDAMPYGARDAVLARILRNTATVSPEQLEQLIAAAEKLVDEITEPIAPKA